jgi:hypothetical protein
MRQDMVFSDGGVSTYYYVNTICYQLVAWSISGDHTTLDAACLSLTLLKTTQIWFNCTAFLCRASAIIQFPNVSRRRLGALIPV